MEAKGLSYAVHLDEGRPIQEKLLPPIPKVFESRGSGLHHERSPQRDFWKSLRATIVGTQANLSGVLLAHHAKRRSDLH